MQAICHKAKNNSKAFGSDLESISKLNINIYEKKENVLGGGLGISPVRMR